MGLVIYLIIIDITEEIVERLRKVQQIIAPYWPKAESIIHLIMSIMSKSYVAVIHLHGSSEDGSSPRLEPL